MSSQMYNRALEVAVLTVLNEGGTLHMNRIAEKMGIPVDTLE